MRARKRRLMIYPLLQKAACEKNSPLSKYLLFSIFFLDLFYKGVYCLEYKHFKKSSNLLVFQIETTIQNRKIHDQIIISKYSRMKSSIKCTNLYLNFSVYSAKHRASLILSIISIFDYFQQHWHIVSIYPQYFGVLHGLPLQLGFPNNEDNNKMWFSFNLLWPKSQGWVGTKPDPKFDPTRGLLGQPDPTRATF